MPRRFDCTELIDASTGITKGWNVGAGKHEFRPKDEITREAMAAFLRSFVDDSSVAGDLRFVRLEGHELDLEAPASLFSGEQSNSSVFFGEDAVLKLFRKVTAGENPDVTTHRALTEAGSTHVAALYGWIEHEDSQLGMLQQFLRTASDGWGQALASVRDLFAEADLHAMAGTLHLHQTSSLDLGIDWGDVDLVVVSIGGNDFDFAGVVEARK